MTDKSLSKLRMHDHRAEHYIQAFSVLDDLPGNDSSFKKIP
jgi:hypothetical protein